ncbi:hypothetical protein BKA69DRAFT_1083793 [Paraphysoderma sedebokerense]|nr:hypothetical protein BKA69DRAFT_1083793 [Paraphysoderma sedebokerense]
MADSILSQRDHIESIREEIEFHRHEMKNQGQPVVYFSVDVETWEKNHDIVTEIGWSVKYFNPEHRTNSNHFVVSEHSEYRNGKYVPDAKFLFNFGTYKFISLSNSIYAMNGALEYWRDSGYQIYMICHDSRKDQVYTFYSLLRIFRNETNYSVGMA